MIALRLLTVVLFAALVAGRVVKPKDELKAVVVLFRHGNRAPYSSWPNDPYYGDSTLWPDGYGMLNNFGKQRHFQLGQWFRKRYEGFLPLRYNISDIYVRTTDIDRTHMSAASNLAGLYQPYNEQIWNRRILWQPIPIHTVPSTSDNILADGVSCAKYTSLKSAFLASDEYAQLEAENADFYEQLAEVTGYTVDELSISTVSGIQSAITIFEDFSLPLPEWTKILKPQIDVIAAKSFQLSTYTPELARLRSGPFFSTLTQYFNAMINGSTSSINSIPVRKFWMLSAHDTTVADRTNSLGIYPDAVPQFASTVIWELKNKRGSDEHYVNIYFKNYTHFDGLTIPGCEFNCEVNKFIELIEPVTVSVDDWETECSEE